MPVQALAPSRDDTLIATGYEFRPGDPIRVGVVHRDQRARISRHGVVSLPVVRVGPPEAEVVRRIGEAARALYQDLLELGS